MIVTENTVFDCRPICSLGDCMSMGTSGESIKERHQASSTASVSDPSRSQDLKDVYESLGFLEKSPPVEK
jgi:hypothetical protein